MSYLHPAYAFLLLPILIVIYNIMPKKIKPYILLVASLGFFAFISKKLIVFLILSIVSIYITARILGKIDDKRNIALENAEKSEKKTIKEKYKKKKKIALIIGILFNVSFLFFFKYLNFFGTNANYIFDLLGLNISYKVVKYAAPIGISYYTLQAISYIVDVYNEKTVPAKNFFKVALYLSFFPQIMEGPIAKYDDTAEDLFAGNKVTYKNFCFGYQRILYGFFKKYVIADRLNVVVKKIFEGYASFSGLPIWIGVISYTIMLYMEFSGTMDVILGTGEMFKVKIPENFRQPFFAKNISEFWTRWHISLGTWFKNYIFYPVSLAKPVKKLSLKARKVLGNHLGPLVGGSIALFAVWFLNGLWHGAGWTYLFYGLYQFTLILLGNIFEPLIIKMCSKLHINRQNIFYRIFQSVKMTIFVFIGELFFRASTLEVGFAMLKKMFVNFQASSLFNGDLLKLGLDKCDYLIIFVALIVIFVISLLKERNINIREELSKKNIFIRWGVYYLLIVSIIIFGAYGTGYVPVDPIYVDF